MKLRSTKSHFLKRLNVVEQDLDQLLPGDGIEAMLTFYEEERVDGCDLDDDGDMLRFEWGTYLLGDGESFRVSMTRQLMLSEQDEPYQLRLIFKFDSEVGSGTRDGGQWCASPDQLTKFRKYVSSSKGFKLIGTHRPDTVMLTFGKC